LAAHLARSPKKAKLRAANRPSAAKKGGSGESPGYDKTQHVQVLKKAKRSGQAEISGEYSGGLPRLWRSQAERSGQAERSKYRVRGSSPDYGYPSRTHAEKGQAERSGKGGFGDLPRLRLPISHACRRRLIRYTAARPSAAKNRGSGGSPDYETTQRTFAQKKKMQRPGRA
jgi:hypothetical protein